MAAAEGVTVAEMEELVEPKRSAFALMSLSFLACYVVVMLLWFALRYLEIRGVLTSMCHDIEGILRLWTLISATVAVHRDKKKDLAIISLILSILVPFTIELFWWYIYWPMIAAF